MSFPFLWCCVIWYNNACACMKRRRISGRSCEDVFCYSAEFLMCTLHAFILHSLCYRYKGRLIVLAIVVSFSPLTFRRVTFPLALRPSCYQPHISLPTRPSPSPTHPLLPLLIAASFLPVLVTFQLTPNNSKKFFVLNDEFFSVHNVTWLMYLLLTNISKITNCQ